MHHAAAMRRYEPLAQLESAPQELIQGQRSLAQPVGQRLPLQVLHDEKAQAILRADVVKVADVRVVQGGDGPRLPLEPLPGHRFVRQVGREDLDGDRPIEPGVAGAIHLSHAPGAERCEDFVRPQTGAGR